MRVKFKKGDTVIYPQHGACIVVGTKKMEAFGSTQEYLILKTVINEMTLSVPTLKASEVGVRPPVNPEELEDLVAVLSKPDPRVRTRPEKLPGDVPSPANPPSGCYFHPRCRYAQEICSAERPPLKDIGGDHWVACHLAEELALKGASRLNVLPIAFPERRQPSGSRSS
mgnify:CR=1 FL=1